MTGDGSFATAFGGENNKATTTGDGSIATAFGNNNTATTSGDTSSGQRSIGNNNTATVDRDASNAMAGLRRKHHGHRRPAMAPHRGIPVRGDNGTVVVHPACGSLRLRRTGVRSRTLVDVAGQLAARRLKPAQN